VYQLEGHLVDEHFRIDHESGDIELFKPLDRDFPGGTGQWRFMARAIDQNGSGLVGYADIHVYVRDINDNAPIFPPLMEGWVDENREPEAYVMTVQVRYSSFLIYPFWSYT